MIKLSIVIPCCNESKNIQLILDGYSKFAQNNAIEVIFVDNASTDDTAKVLNELLPKYPFAHSIFEGVPGYGSAIMAGLNLAQGEYLGWTHGDMQTPPGDVLEALKLIEMNGNGVDLYVKGLREGRPFFDQLFTWGMTVFETIYMGVLLNDINGQPNIFHRSFFEKWQKPPLDFSIDLYVFYQARKDRLNIIRFPVVFFDRIHGQSNWNTGLASKWRLIKRTISFSRNLKRNKL